MLELMCQSCLLMYNKMIATETGMEIQSATNINQHTIYLSAGPLVNHVPILEHLPFLKARVIACAVLIGGYQSWSRCLHTYGHSAQHFHQSKAVGASSLGLQLTAQHVLHTAQARTGAV